MNMPMLELRRRPSGVRIDNRKPIKTPHAAAQALGPLVEGLAHEIALILCLDGRQRAIGAFEIARGSHNVVHISPREVLICALHAGASSFLFAHNHPSNDALPSDEDIELTRRITAGADLIGIPMLDSLILTDSEGYSFNTSRRFPWKEVVAWPSLSQEPLASAPTAAASTCG